MGQGSGRYCPKCKQHKTLDDFYYNGIKRRRYSGICKVCHNIKCAEWHGTAKGRYRELIYSASKRNLTMNISPELFQQLIFTDCVYCAGFFPDTRTGSGLDRKDRFKGYEPDNVVRACGTCNSLKNVLSFEAGLLAITQTIKELKAEGTTGAQFKKILWPNDKKRLLTPK